MRVRRGRFFRIVYFTHVSIVRMSRADLLGSAITLLVGGAAYFIGGGWAALGAIFLGFILLVVAHFRKIEEESETQLGVTLRAAANVRPAAPPSSREEIRYLAPSDWQSLASRFERIGRGIRADWTRMSDGIESWAVCGGVQCAECEALCKLGGAMLMRSIKVFPSVPPDVLAEPDAVFRWLCFLKAKKLLRDMQYGLDGDKPFYFGTIYELGPVSYRTCLECSAIET